jgi:hypothetical protein
MGRPPRTEDDALHCIWSPRRHPLALAAAVVGSLSLARMGPAAADPEPIRSRHLEVSREAATPMPRREADQAIVNGWPLYRTARGQAAFNDAMATLKATDGPTPHPRNFRGCADLHCPLRLPAIDAGGWIPAGRLWLSATEYVLIAHSPRQREGASYRRRSIVNMRYFVFHEFHNSSRNVDLYDTISSHFSHVFVPFYMSKPDVDAAGRRFVTIVQVAPYDVVSVHATNLGSAGSGVEVARNASDTVEPLQNLAGVVLATIIKTAVPRLEVVNHQGEEGRPMLEAYKRRQSALRGRATAAALALPFVPAAPARVAAAAAPLADLVLRDGWIARGPIVLAQSPPAFSLLEPPRPVPRPTRPR